MRATFVCSYATWKIFHFHFARPAISIVTMAAMKYELKMDQTKAPHKEDRQARRRRPPPEASIFDP